MSTSPNTPIDYNELRMLVMVRSYAEKLDLLHELQRDIFPTRFADLLKRIRSRAVSTPINMNEIIEEVELVRMGRYTTNTNANPR